MAIAVGTTASGAQSDRPVSTRSDLSRHTPVLQRSCVGCHNARTRTADLALDGFDINDVAAHPEIWEKVVRKLRTGAMPPAGMPRPDGSDLRVACLRTRGCARRRCCRTATAWCAMAASPQSNRIRQRRSRSARARDRRHVASAGRRCRSRLRQQCGRTRDFTNAPRTLSVGRSEDQRARHRRRHAAGANLTDICGAWRYVAGRARRGATSGDARRRACPSHVSAGWSVRRQGRPAADESRRRARTDRASRDRVLRGR